MTVHRNESGDTIIEVLLAMVIVGLTLGIGFNIARNAQQTGYAARERSEAVSLAEGQLELLNKNLEGGSAADLGYDGSDFCILNTNAYVADASDTGSECYGIRNLNGEDGFYRLSMDSVGVDNNTYISRVIWEVPNSQEPARVELRYRTYE